MKIKSLIISLSMLAIVLAVLGMLPDFPFNRHKPPQKLNASEPDHANLSINSKKSEKADQLLSQIISKLEGFSWYSARVHFEGELFGESIYGKGLYCHAPRFRSRFQLETNLSAYPEPAILLQVCTGETFWTYKNIAGEKKLSEVDVYEIQKVFQAARKRNIPVSQVPFPGLGGLPQLLRGLRDTCDFYLSNTNENEPIVLYGQWSAATLTSWYPKEKKKIIESKTFQLEELPEQFPHLIKIEVDRKTNAVLSIEHLKTNGIWYSERFQEFKEGEQWSLMKISFNEIKINSPVDESLFNFSPRGVTPPVNRTGAFLDKMKLD